MEGARRPAARCGSCGPDESAQARWFLSIVGSTPLLTLDGDALRLISGTTVIDLVEKQPSPPSEPSGVDVVEQRELSGRTFWGVTVSEGGTDRMLVAGPGVLPRLELAFQDDELVVRVGCFVGTTPYRIEDGRLVGGPVATEPTCPPPMSGGSLQEQDEWTTAFLSSGPTATLTGDRLRLHNGAAAMELSDRVYWHPSAGVADVRWRLVATVRDGVESPIPDLAVPPTLQLTLFPSGGQEWRLAVQDGCNTGGAPAIANPTELVLGALGTTEARCDDERTAVAERVHAVLQGRVTYALDGDRLVLSNFGDRLIFER